MSVSSDPAHEALHEQAMLLLNAQRIGRMGSWAYHALSGQVQWSDSTCELFGIGPGEFRGTFEHFIGFVLPEDRPALEAALAAPTPASPLMDAEYRIRRPDGSVRWMRERGNATFDAEGRMTARLGMVMDVTEGKRAEEQLAHGVALARIASRVARIGGWTIDLPEGRLTWSDECCAIHEVPPGYRPTLEEGLSLFPPEYRDQVTMLVTRCAEQGIPYEFEVPKHTLRGRRIWVRSIGEAVRDAQGRIVGLQGAFQDITERRAMEDQLRQAQRLDSVGQLTGGVAHDFNNLLTVILGNAEMLGEELADDPRLGPLAQVVMQAAQRGADLTQRLLAFARRQALEPRVVDVNQLVTGMHSILRRALGAPVPIVFAPAPDLWPALVDPVQLDNALLNLCLNARDAMPQGGQLRIETGNASLDAAAVQRHPDVKPGDYVVLAVADTGTGIAPEHLGRVFEPFFTTKEKGKGTGLGLAMVYGFVKQTGGHVGLDSRPGQGTTVRLYLPRAAGSGAAPSPVAQAPGTPATGGSETILLVEDDVLVRAYARTQLAELGYSVVLADDCEHALQVLRGPRRVDLLFTDVVMPGMSGRELAERARRERPGLRVLYTSGYAEDEIVHDGRLEAGVQLLAKPYRRDELARRIRQALDAG